MFCNNQFQAINLSTLNETERIAQAGNIANALVSLTTPTQEPAFAEDISLAVNTVFTLSKYVNTYCYTSLNDVKN